MKKQAWMILALCALAMAAPAAGQITGHYMESRTADVYTGPCFANGEVGLTGHEAVLAWKIENGKWGNVELGGLSVVAVVVAGSTLGDPFTNPLPARAMLIVDSQASAAQRAALITFVQAQTAGLLSQIVAVEVAPIRFVADVNGQHGAYTLEAGNLARIETRMITPADQICHNEEVFYTPLAAGLDHSMPAVAIAAGYRGNHLGRTWNDAQRRSAFVGSFSR